MPRVADPAKQLEQTIARLQERRRTLTADLARIDALCEKYGIQLQGRKRPGRPAGRRKAASSAVAAKPARRGRRRKRGRFAKSASTSIIDFLKSCAGKSATTADVNKHWQAEGRRGNAYVTLGHLAKQRKVKRENLKGQRGSRYTAV